MSGSDILGIGTSALLAYQQALQTTGNNIANVNTPGYTRQQVDLASRLSQPAGGYFLGSGVQINGVERILNQFVNTQVTDATAANARYQTYSQYAQQVDNLLANQSAGLQPAVQDFFNAVQGVANNPSSISARQQLITQGGALTGRFNTLYQQMNSISTQLNGQISNEVTTINSLASQIAKLNTQIVAQSSNKVAGQPNSLLDQRDQLVNQLSQHVSVKTVTQSDGSLNVMIGTGQALVVGADVTQLGTAPLAGDPSQVGLVFKTQAGDVPVTNVVAGGNLGGLLDARNKVVVPALNGLGRVAIGISSAFNAQQANGIDLTGAVGGPFFKVPQASIFPATGNAGAGVPSVRISDISKLTTKDYQLSYNGTSWSLRNASTGQAVPMSGAGTTASPFTADGLSIVVNPPGGFSAGDGFSIEPTRYAARDIGMAATDPRQIAAAAPVASAASSSNAGTATISPAQPVTNAAGVTLEPVTITISGNPPNTWTAVNTSTTPPTAIPGGTGTYDPTANPSTAIQLNGWKVTLGAGAKAGDVFTVTPTGPGDNGNALKLAGLQQAKLLENGATISNTGTTTNGPTATLDGAYNQLVADVGTNTQAAKTNASNQKSLLAQATALQQSVSGVNLDQQASNLLKYEQAYQASAKVIATANTLFQSLLSAVR